MNRSSRLVVGHEPPHPLSDKPACPHLQPNGLEFGGAPTHAADLARYQEIGRPGLRRYGLSE